MPKTFQLIALSSLVLMLTGCSWFQSEQTPNPFPANQANQIQPITNLEVQETKQINPELSSVKWRGEFITGNYGHDGTVPVQGFVGFNSQNELISGTFQLDVANLTDIDLEGEMQEVLLNHLKSKDFFNTAEFPTASLNITSSEKVDTNSYVLTADLKIKDQTNSIQFKAILDGTNIKSMFDIDRTRWGINYGSGKFFDNLKDQTIKDEIMFDINLSF